MDEKAEARDKVTRSIFAHEIKKLLNEQYFNARDSFDGHLIVWAGGYSICDIYLNKSDIQIMGRGGREYRVSYDELESVVDNVLFLSEHFFSTTAICDICPGWS